MTTRLSPLQGWGRTAGAQAGVPLGPVPMCFLDMCRSAAWLSSLWPQGLDHERGLCWVTTWVRVPWASGLGSPLRLSLGVQPD